MDTEEAEAPVDGHIARARTLLGLGVYGESSDAISANVLRRIERGFESIFERFERWTAAKEAGSLCHLFEEVDTLLLNRRSTIRCVTARPHKSGSPGFTSRFAISPTRRPMLDGPLPRGLVAWCGSTMDRLNEYDAMSSEAEVDNSILIRRPQWSI